MRYRLAIFDMDGTILDTLEDLKNATNEALSRYGFPKRSLEEVRRFVGNGVRKLIERAVPAGTNPDVEEEIYQYFREYYGKHSNEETCAYEGITTILQELRLAGVKTAVVSNKPDPAVKDLCDIYFKNLFDVAIGDREDLERKPAPDSCRLAMKQLGIDEADAVYIGDSEVDVATARNAGLPCLTVLWGFRDREELIAAGATDFVEDWKELEYQLISPTLDELTELVHSADPIIFDEKKAASVTEKGAADYVTQVDLGVQTYLAEKLKELDPNAILLAEEQERFEGDQDGRYYILDPIDGTTNLIHHYNMSAVALGLYHRGRMQLGVVYNPFTKETFAAEYGKGATLGGKPIHVSDYTEMKYALVSLGSSPYEKDKAPKLFELFQKLFYETTDFRRGGSAALDLCYVACGRQDIYLEYNLKPWDYSAGSLILTEAGGHCVRWHKDEKIPYLDNSDILAVNDGLLSQMQEFLEREWKGFED